MTPIEPEYLNQRDAARYLSISVRTLHRWKTEGLVAVTEFPGGVIRYAVADLDAAGRRSSSKQPA